MSMFAESRRDSLCKAMLPCVWPGSRAVTRILARLGLRAFRSAAELAAGFRSAKTATVWLVLP